MRESRLWFQFISFNTTCCRCRIEESSHVLSLTWSQPINPQPRGRTFHCEPKWDFSLDNLIEQLSSMVMYSKLLIMRQKKTLTLTPHYFHVTRHILLACCSRRRIMLLVCHWIVLRSALSLQRISALLHQGTGQHIPYTLEIKPLRTFAASWCTTRKSTTWFS